MNRIKCKYCEWATPRFSGHKRYNGKKLFLHAIDNHENEFLQSIGFNGTLEQYLDFIDMENTNDNRED